MVLAILDCLSLGFGWAVAVWRNAARLDTCITCRFLYGSQTARDEQHEQLRPVVGYHYHILSHEMEPSKTDTFMPFTYLVATTSQETPCTHDNLMSKTFSISAWVWEHVGAQQLGFVYTKLYGMLMQILRSPLVSMEKARAQLFGLFAPGRFRKVALTRARQHASANTQKSVLETTSKLCMHACVCVSSHDCSSIVEESTTAAPAHIMNQRGQAKARENNRCNNTGHVCAEPKTLPHHVTCSECCRYGIIPASAQTMSGPSSTTLPPTVGAVAQLVSTPAAAACGQCRLEAMKLAQLRIH
eukprot:6461018-Amphidinium_carterae.1